MPYNNFELPFFLITLAIEIIRDSKNLKRMKNNDTRFNKVRASLWVLVFICSASSLKAGNIKIKEGKPQLKLEQSTYTNLKFSNTVTDLSFRTVKNQNSLYTEIYMPGCGASNRTGDPKLPMLKKLIEVPEGAGINIHVISYTLTEYKLSDYGIAHQLFPAQPSVSKDLSKPLPPFEYNTSTYSVDAFNVDSLVTVQMLGTMRGLRMARLDIAPVRYNPVKNTIQVYNDLQVEISFSGANAMQTTANKNRAHSPFFEGMFSNELLNHQQTDQAKDLITTYPVKYVIVADPAFQSALQPFVQWKTRKGFRVVEAYTSNPQVGTTALSIKNYLQNLYNAGTQSDPAPSFVLLVGDIAQIPSFSGQAGSHVSDLYFCEYTGDYLPEVYYGRFSATTVAELQPQIDKTLEYEQYTMPDPSFLAQTVMIAGQDANYGPLHGDGQINYGTATYFNGGHNLTSNTYLHSTSGSSASQIIQNVSNGVCFANYTAHGWEGGWADPSFGVSDVNSLQNAHKYPLMVGNCCLSNKFDNNVCFGEALLRANEKGAIGYIGGSNNTYWNEDYYWGVGYKTVGIAPVYDINNLGAYDRTFHDHGETAGEWYATQGQMVYAGNLAVTQSGSSAQYYWEIYHLMGDPSLMVYYGVPPQLNATYPALITLGTTSFTVNTEPDAYVALSIGGVLYGAAIADNMGVAVINFSPISVPGTADVVATKQNRAPFINTVVVASNAGPYVIYDSKLVHDVTGNNNSQADYGEDCTLDVTLENVGLAIANGVSATLSTTDPYVTITDNVQTWGNINSNVTSLQNNAYAFTVDDSIPDQHIVQFTLTATDAGGASWTATFNVILNAPVLSIGDMLINDAAGNNNGNLDPGETVDITISYSNTGHANAAGTVATLLSPNSYITVNSASVNLGTLNATGGNANGTFNITVSSLAPLGSYATFNTGETAGVYTAQETFIKIIGIVEEDWETNGFTEFPWEEESPSPWTITTVDPYDGLYCSKSGDISHSDTSTLSITLNVLVNDSVSFYKKVSSEDMFDYLKFYIDGIQLDQWSGEIVWSRSSYAVSAGTHTFTWAYEKDFVVDAGDDFAWVDDISFPPVEIQGVSVTEMNGNDNSMICYPNPFRDKTTIYYNLNGNEKVTIKVYNTVGQEVATLVNNEFAQTGQHAVTFSSQGMASGVYYCVLSSGSKKIVRKLAIAY